METSRPRVGVYARISEDKDGSQTATARQMEDAQAMAARRGWDVVDTFEDVDLSAYNTRVKRPEFERMLNALLAGELDGIVVWKLDRLTRQQRDLARVMEACEPNKAFIASVMEPIDTRESYGQFVAELLVAQARMESANSSARQRRKAQQQREQGIAPTNGKRCFGYNQRYTEIVEEEAAVLREARDRLFAGESLRSICLDLEERGVRSTDGNGIRGQHFKRTLKSPTISGQRVLEGRLYQGNWTPIFSPEESRQLGILLNRRPNQPRQAPVRKYLLTGLIRCGRCEQRMHAHARNGGTRAYICNKAPGYANCGSMSVRAEPLETLVKELLMAAIDNKALCQALQSQESHDEGLVEAIRHDEIFLEGLSKDFYVEQLLSREEFLAAREGLNARLEANRAKLIQRSQSRVLGELLGRPSLLGEAWEVRALEWRRSVASALLERVVILPGKPGRLPFDPERVKPVWRY